MDASAALGVAIDIATPGEVNDIVSKHGESLYQRLTGRDQRRIRRPIVSNAQADATGKAVVRLGPGPAAGRMWDLRNICVTGADDHTTVTSAVGGIYAGDADNIGLPDLVDTVPVVPFSETYSREVVMIPFGHNFFVVIYGIVAATVITVTARVDDYEAGQVVPSSV